jgi:integrase
LVYIPVRQQEIRQYELGKTLFRKLDAKGRPYYEVVITEHKNKAKTGKNRKYKLPSILTADLDAWINVWRPKAVEAVQSLPAWLKFKGFKPERLEILQQRLDAAKRGEFERKVNNPQKYIENLERRILCIRSIIAAWETARTNVTNNNSLFFSFRSGNYLNIFGQPLSVESVWSLVITAISKATLALFGEARWTNPHALRHIAAKHVRLLKKDTKGMAAAMGHSEEQGDKYANQIMTESDLIDELIDSWWESDDLDLNE